MDNKKIYQIVINGVQESVKAVDSLNDALGMLDEKIKSLEKARIDVAATTNNSTTKSKIADLQSEDKLLKQIQQTEKQIADAEREDYQRLLAQKDLLKQITDQQKERAAQERLVANTYENTMQGIKQQLADIKAVMQTTDIESDEFRRLTESANVLNNKLKELEQSYGQFGRNVGNYSSALAGLDKLTVEIGGVVREFGSAREASRTLKNELTALEVQGRGNTQEAKELRTAYYQLKSAMDDATKSSKAMDEAMDWMESFTAMASIGNGIMGFFGFDNTEIQRSIQRLVSLQNVLKGIETIRKQLSTSEGIGRLISKGFDKIDSYTNSLNKLNETVLGTGTKAKVAAVGINFLNTALKGMLTIGWIGALTLIAEGIQKIFEAVNKWAKGNADLVSSEKILNGAIEATNASLENRLMINQANESAKNITSTEKKVRDEEAYAKAIQETIGLINKRAKMEEENSTFAKSMNGKTSWSDFLEKDKGVTTFGGFNTATENIDGLIKRYEELSKAVENNTALVLKNERTNRVYRMSVDDVKDELNHLEQFLAGKLVQTMNMFDLSTQNGRRAFADFVNGILNSNSSLMKSVLLRLPEIVKNGESKLGDALNQYLDLIKSFVQQANSITKMINFEGMVNSILESADETGRLAYERQKQNLTDAYNGLSKIQQKLQKENYEKAMAALAKMQDKRNKKVANNYKKDAKAIEQAEAEFNKIRIELMKDGYEKQIKQLEEEKRAKLEKIRIDGIKVGELTLEVEKLYDKKILEAKRDWAHEMLQTYQNLANDIDRVNRDIFASENSLNKIKVDTEEIQKVNSVLLPNYHKGDNTEETISAYDDYYRQLFNIKQDAINKLEDLDIEALQKERDNNKADEKLRHERIVSEETSLKMLAELQQYAASHNGASIIEQGTDEEFKQLEDKMQETLKEMRGTLVDAYNEGKIDFKQFCKLVEDENKAHGAKMLNIENEYATKANELATQNEEQRKEGVNKYYTSMMNIVRTQEGRIASILEEVPRYIKGWNIVNINETKNAYNEAVKQYQELKTKVIEIKISLLEQLKVNHISPSDFLIKEEELDNLLELIKKKLKSVQDEQRNTIGDFINSLMPYIQETVSSMNTILNAVWDAQDTSFDKEQEALEKYNELLEKKLDEQQEIVQDHTDNINNIEEQLADARGGRRQHLIDQLNAEIAAQRAAKKQEDAIAKEKEAQERRQEELTKKRKKAEYERNLLQAIVNGAMAVTMAAVNEWPIPAIPMMALAAATTAAQIAIMQANKPYRYGGQLEGGLVKGKRHTEGGVPVGNTGIEVEGDEMIIRRESTLPNVDLLDYINKSQKRMTLDDFIEFYSSGRPRKIFSSLSNKYAQGGQLPTLSSEYSFDNRLLEAFETYANRPYYVAVTDIEKKMNDVRYVRSLAGLS